MKPQAVVAFASLIALSSPGCEAPTSQSEELGDTQGPEEPGDTPGDTPGGTDEPGPPQSAASEQCGMELIPERSLYFNDTDALRSDDGDSPFSLRRTLEAIVATSDNPDASAEALLDSLLGDFFLLPQQIDQPYTANFPSGGEDALPVKVDGIRLEAFLGAGRLLNEDRRSFMRPVALFNRLDLAPGSAETCGEYRIVYAKRNDGGILTSIFNRFLLIFEAKLDNPRPDLGIEGCRKVAEFWADLTKMDAATAVAELERFYYEGLDGFDPVVTFDNYRNGGQVRSNHFVTPIWQLREWNTASDGEGRPHFAMEPLENTPIVEFYDRWNPYSIFARKKRERFNQLRDAFRADFLDTQVANLAAPEASGVPLDAFAITNGVASDPRPVFEDFQSNSQGRADQPIRNIEGGFRDQIEDRAASYGLNAAHILNRAGAMTCGGCHQFSGGVEIAPGVNWPERDGAFAFVHVREDGELSPTLHSTFLPHRQTALEQYLCDIKPLAPTPGSMTWSALTNGPLPTH